MFKILPNSIIFSCFVITMLSCGKSPDIIPTTPDDDTPLQDNIVMPTHIKVTVSGNTLPIKIVDNNATRSIVEVLKKSSITFTAQDYGDFEKVGPLGRSFPTNNEQMTTQPGDVVLYSGNQVVLFYGSNTWNYTRIGKIEYSTIEALKSFLKAGEGSITITLSLQ